MNIRQYWHDTISQNAKQMIKFFAKDASINWHNTNECFTVDEFIKVNCTYPDVWYGEVERIEKLNDLFITVTRVYNKNVSFHAVSFIKVKDDMIIAIDEYWGEDGNMPKWRDEMNIGTKIF
ncbi:MAG: hypothetical protein CSB16_03150 [Clostridiales bacterium]|nr:MAG: hypothetical protein CSB16_03150 [Clostridiales bacterium]